MNINDAQQRLNIIAEKKKADLDDIQEEKSMYNEKLKNNRINYSLIEKEIIRNKIKKLLNFKYLILRDKIRFSDSPELLQQRIAYYESLRDALEERMRVQINHISEEDNKITEKYIEIRTVGYYISKLNEKIAINKLLSKDFEEMDDLEIESFIEEEEVKGLLRK